MEELSKGLHRNISRFILLVLINVCVGAMVGLERTIFPAMAQSLFGMTAHTAILSFIALFGATKAVTNYFAGNLSDTIGRKKVLVAGWLLAVPVPLLLLAARSWTWVLVANVLLGVSQGLAWSSTVIMKLDLVETKYRGLATGLNEFAGYGGMAATAWLTGRLAESYGLRPVPLYPGIALVLAGLVLSAWATRETVDLARGERSSDRDSGESAAPSRREIIVRTSFSDRDLSAASLGGLVTNLKDGMAWGIFPLFFAKAGVDLGQIGALTAIYPAAWGVLQLVTGPLSDRIGRKWLISAGLGVQAAALTWISLQQQFAGFAVGSALLGMGTAMAYPVLLALVSDVAGPTWRGSALGVYRFWRDCGYAFGAVATGVLADSFGIRTSMQVVAGLALLSAVIVSLRLRGRRSD